MAQRADQKAESRARILASAGRGFRTNGYGGLGVDGLAKEAGVTSGAFYKHFTSKAAAFRDAIVAGMQELRAGVEHMRETHGEHWQPAFIDFYLGERRRAGLADSCALQSLTGEVARADPEARRAYERELREVIATAAEGPDVSHAAERRDEAIALLALLSGGVSLARAVEDPAFSDEIANAVRRVAARIEAKPTKASDDATMPKGARWSD